MKWMAAVLVISLLGVAVYTIATQPTSDGSSTSRSERELPLTKNAVPSRQYTVLLDVSTSRPEALIGQGRQFVSTVIDGMNYDDRLVMVEMYEAGVKDAKADLDVQIRKSEEVTSLEEQERLDGARKGLKEAVGLFFQKALKKPVVHTDIFTTLSIASEKVSPQKHNCLIVLSDMLQSSKEFEFEHLQRMPSATWLDNQKQSGLIQPLHGIKIVVIGADPSTHEGVVVRDFWQKYFAASNASLPTGNYRTTPPTDTSVCD